MDIEAGEAVVDYQFHHKFWSLIQYLQDYTKALKNEEEWSKAMGYLGTVLQTLNNVEPTAADNKRGRHSSELCLSITSKFQSFFFLSSVDKMETEEGYFTKFLTAPQLMALEMRDPYFCKHVLVQILIFCQALQRPSTKAEETLTASKVQYPYFELRYDHLFPSLQWRSLTV